MFRSAIGGLIAIPLAAIVGCGGYDQPYFRANSQIVLHPELGVRNHPDSLETEERLAMMEVFRETIIAYNQACESLSVEDQPSKAVKALEQFLAEIQKIDLEKCPAEFKTGYMRYRQAYREFIERLTRMPDDYTEGEFSEYLAALFRGETATGIKLGGDLVDSSKEISSRWKALAEIGEVYGIQAR